MRTPKLTNQILETLADASLTMAALFAAIATSSYGEPWRKTEQRADKIKDDILFGYQKKVTRNTFDSLLSKMKKEGLIEIRDNKLAITEKGREKLKVAKLGLWPRKDYQAEPDQTIKIIIFDIPEKERKKRDWLRFNLEEMGFEMLQKSVWVGKKKIPKEFLNDLARLKIADYVEIFGVSKTGSLRKIR